MTTRYILIAWAFVGLLSGSAAAAPESVIRVCVLSEPHLDGPTSASYLDALRIESRKAGLTWQWDLVETGEGCDPGTSQLSFPAQDRAVLRTRKGQPRRMQIESGAPELRARLVARWAVGRLRDSLQRAEDGPWPESQANPARAQTSAGPRWFVRAGGVSMQQQGIDGTLSGLSVELGHIWEGQRFLIALQANRVVSPALFEQRAVDLRLDLREVVAMGRAAYRLDPIEVRVGLGAGWQRGLLPLSLIPTSGATDERERESQSGSLSDSEVHVGMAVGEVELGWLCTRYVGLGVLVSIHEYLGSTGHIVAENSYYATSSRAFRGQLWIEVRL